jgi:hypothetical protein
MASRYDAMLDAASTIEPKRKDQPTSRAQQGMHCDILDDNLEKLLDDTSTSHLVTGTIRSFQLVLPNGSLSSINNHGGTATTIIDP